MVCHLHLIIKYLPQAVLDAVITDERMLMMFNNYVITIEAIIVIWARTFSFALFGHESYLSLFIILIITFKLNNESTSVPSGAFQYTKLRCCIALLLSAPIEFQRTTILKKKYVKKIYEKTMS